MKDGPKPAFTLSDIHIDVGDAEFEKGKKLFDSGKVRQLKSDSNGFSAIVTGTHDYTVSIRASDFNRGYCNCYLGQKDVLCKHLVALAIATVFAYRPENAIDDGVPVDHAVCSGEVRDITAEELSIIRGKIRSASTHLKSYNGPSKTWFAYQDSLCKGKRLILTALSDLPVCKKSVDICINVIKKIDTKLATSGIDDSDGTVGELIEEVMELLSMFVSEIPDLKSYILDTFPKETNFGWESELPHHFD